MCYIYIYRNIHMNIFIIRRNDHRTELPKYRLFCHPGDMCHQLETFLFVTTGYEGALPAAIR